MNYTCHSEYGPLASVFIKTAETSFRSDDQLKAEWRSLNYLSKPDFQKSKIEFTAFESLLKSEQVDVKYFPHDLAVGIDSIYSRDASLATDYGMIICNMGKQARKTEPKAQHTVFIENEIPVLGAIKDPGTLEGGDVAWLDQKTLAVGLTYRTNIEGIRQLRNLISPYDIELLVVDLPHYKGDNDVFHLMSILSPVDKDLAVVYSPLMPIRFRNLLKDRGFEFVEVHQDEFETLGCNVLAVAPRKCIMVAGNPLTEAALKKTGCEVITYPGQEISVKGGGGPTCLTRPYHRAIIKP